jgi:hypothetical protein
LSDAEVTPPQDVEANGELYTGSGTMSAESLEQLGPITALSYSTTEIGAVDEAVDVPIAPQLLAKKIRSPPSSNATSAPAGATSKSGELPATMRAFVPLLNKGFEITVIVSGSST